jgi:hypothetical protein
MSGICVVCMCVCAGIYVVCVCVCVCGVYVHVCVWCMCMCVWCVWCSVVWCVSTGACGSKKRAPDPLGLRLQAVMSCLMWVLGTKSRFKSSKHRKSRAFFPAAEVYLLKSGLHYSNTET